MSYVYVQQTHQINRSTVTGASQNAEAESEAEIQIGRRGTH